MAKIMLLERMVRNNEEPQEPQLHMFCVVTVLPLQKKLQKPSAFTPAQWLPRL